VFVVRDTCTRIFSPYSLDIILGLDKINRTPGERGNPSLPGSHKNHYHSVGTSKCLLFLLLRLIDGILGNNHCHVLKLFLLIFLGCIEEVDSITAEIMSVHYTTINRQTY